MSEQDRFISESLTHDDAIRAEQDAKWRDAILNQIGSGQGVGDACQFFKCRFPTQDCFACPIRKLAEEGVG